MLRVLDRMGRGALTAHGFRATFKTWASERTSFQNEIVEASLAHTIGAKVEQAYMRGDLLRNGVGSCINGRRSVAVPPRATHRTRSFRYALPDINHFAAARLIPESAVSAPRCRRAPLAGAGGRACPPI